MTNYASRFTLHVARHPHARDAAAVFVLVGMWLLFYWRLFTPVEADRVQFPSGDFTLQSLVFRRYGYSELQQGRLPEWMACIDSGYPYVADPQSTIFYPPAWPNIVLHLAAGVSPFPLAALELESALHVLLAGVLMYAFLRAEVRRRAAALAGALVFAYGGYLTGYPVLQVAIVESAAWLPLALWCARRLAVQGDPRRVALTAVPLALSILAGHPQTYTALFYTVGIYFVYRARRERLAWRHILLRFGAAAGLAVALSLVQLLPSFEYARWSTRASLTYVVSAPGFPLADVLQFIVTGAVSVFQPLYVGLLPLALAGVAIGVRRNRDTVFWLIVALIGFVLSFGSNLAVFDPVYWFVPGYSLFRSQERHALIVSLALGVLAAYGADAVLGSLSRRARAWLRGELRGLAVVWVLLVIALAVASYLSWQGIDPSSSHALPERVALAVMALAASLGVLALRSIRAIHKLWLPVIIVAVIGFDLATANRAVNWAPVYDPFPSQPAIAAIQSDASPQAMFRIHDEQRLPGHTACVNGLNEVGGITPIRLDHYNRFVKSVPREIRWKLLNVRYVVTWRSVLDDHLGQPVDATRLLQVGEGKDAIYVYRMNEDHPRAWVVHQVQTRPDRNSIYAALAEPGFDPMHVAYAVSPVRVEPAAGADRVTVALTDSNHLSVDADLAAPGLLVVSEVTYPGWSATVDGVDAPIVEVDGLLRGVALAAGPSHVEFGYRSTPLIAGGVLSGVALVVWLALILIRKR